MAVQSIAHLVLALGMDRVGTVLDLDRSNGLPDIVSALALGVAAAGAAVLAHGERGAHRGVAWMLALSLGALAIADVLHDGAHPATLHGKIVIVLVCLTGGLLVAIGRGATRRVQATLAIAACLLVGAFIVTGLDRFDSWFGRDRGDRVIEVVIVTKEGFELLGWSLVALALWDAAAGAASTTRPETIARYPRSRG